MKRLLLIIAALLLAVVPCLSIAEGEENEQDLPEAVSDLLSTMDFSEIESYLNQNSEAARLMGGQSLRVFIQKAATGQLSLNLWDEFVGLLGSAFRNQLHLCLTILASGALCSLLSRINMKNSGGSVSESAGYALFALAAIPALAAAAGAIRDSQQAVGGIVRIVDMVFPPMMVMLTTLGAPGAAGTLSATQAATLKLLLQLVDRLIMPMIYLMCVIGVAGRMSGQLKLSKFETLVSSVLKYMLGAVSVLFTANVLLQGFSAASFDSMTMKTAKYTVSTIVPVLGNMFSDTLESVMASMMLIKNATGIAGVIVIIGVAAAPLVSLLAVMFSLKLSAALVEPMGEERLPAALGALADAVQMMVLTLCVVFLLCIMIISLVLILFPK